MIKIGFFLLIAHSGFAQEYMLAKRDMAARNHVMQSIVEPGIIASSLQQVCSYASTGVCWLLSDSIKKVGDSCCARVFEGGLHYAPLRAWVSSIAFSGDNAIFQQYDKGFGVYREFPKVPVTLKQLHNLIQSAAAERFVWGNGKISGAIYDGSESHLHAMANDFVKSLKFDSKMSYVFHDYENLTLAHKVFHYFSAANPLHGTAFPLAVKAMRELGAMFANLFGSQHAIPTSGGQESLRLALRALKERAAKTSVTGTVSALVFDSSDYVAQRAATLNVNSIVVKNCANADEHARALNANFDFIVVNLDDEKTFLNPLYYARDIAISSDVPMHVHMSNRVFLNLMSKHSDFPPLDPLFTLAPQIASISFDTAGMMYAEISATVFRDSQARFDAFEAHVDWIGGIYPGVNSAGSMAGVDYILAYMLSLRLGHEGLKSLAANALRISPQITDNIDEEMRKKIVKSFFDADLQAPLLETFVSIQQRSLETLLVDVSLAIFGTDYRKFVGRITSGGTESIRVALQTYLELFKKRNNNKPIFLMTKTAHVAFNRHLIDNDAEIVYVNTHPQTHAMDATSLEHLIIHYGAHNIAAIIASAPSYPYGISDDIKYISKIAQKHTIPMHADLCLGAYLMQFVDDNPLKIDFSSPEWSGITSVSADLHKYGVTQKGLSLVMVTRELADKLGHDVETILNSRTLPNMATALSRVLAIGYRGYQERARAILKVAKNFVSELKKIPEIIVIEDINSKVPHWVIAFRVADSARLNVQHTYSVSELMAKLGWRINQLGNYSLHMALTGAHVNNANFVSQFVSDLRFVIEQIALHPYLKQSTTTGTYGAASNLSALTIGKEFNRSWLEMSMKLYAENLVTAP